MTNPTSVKSGLVSNEPVLVGAFVTWLFTVLGTFILGHTDLVTSTQWSSLSSFLIPVISALVLGVIATVVRKYVTPFWKSVTGVAGKVGITEAELDAAVKAAVDAAIAKLNLPGVANNSVAVPPVAG